MKKPYIFINIFITKSCNLRCKHCYHENFIETEDENSNMDNFEYLLAEIKKFEEYVNIDHINILGGEPFCDKNIHIKLSKLRSAYDGKINIGTNGTILNDHIIENLKNCNINTIQVSLESHNQQIHDSIRGKGTFIKSIENILKLKKANFNVSIRTTLSKTNVKDVDHIIELGKELNVNLVSFSRYIPAQKNEIMNILSSEDIFYVNDILSKAKSDINVYFENPCNLIYKDRNKADNLLKKNIIAGCSIGISSITLDSQLNIYYCSTLDIPISNLKDNSFINIWNDNAIYEKMRTRDFSGRCGKCRYIKICGGCRSMAYHLNGSIYSEDPTCIYNFENRSRYETLR